jgi:hypothetical protein
MNTHDSAFFVGWAPRVPRSLRGFLAGAAVAVVAGAALLSVGLSASVDDPGGGAFDWAAGEQTLRGTLTPLPYPLLHLAPSARHPAGHTVLLSGIGKSGVTVDPDLAGRTVDATGVMLKRGSIYMMQISNDPGLRQAAPEPPPSAAVSLGHWRLVGEIFDGKCWNGAMRPGSGIAHKACANLCLIGGLPAVLVTTSPVAGSTFLLLADADGGPIPEPLRPLVGLRISIDGLVERRGDLLILRAAPGSAHRL